MNIEPKHIVRFHSHVAKGESSDCWVWTGAINLHGYGSLRIGPTNYGAHRVSWCLNRGAIPTGMQVLHRCDNRRCVNPDHLFVGTHQDNMADRNAKGRQARGDRVVNSRSPGHARGERNGSKTHPERLARGERQGQAKLTEAQVLDIRRLRAEGVPGSELAIRFGVTRQLVSQVCLRQIWTHI